MIKYFLDNVFGVLVDIYNGIFAGEVFFPEWKIRIIGLPKPNNPASYTVIITYLPHPVSQKFSIL